MTVCPTCARRLPVVDSTPELDAGERTILRAMRQRQEVKAWRARELERVCGLSAGMVRRACYSLLARGYLVREVLRGPWSPVWGALSTRDRAVVALDLDSETPDGARIVIEPSETLLSRAMGRLGVSRQGDD